LSTIGTGKTVTPKKSDSVKFETVSFLASKNAREYEASEY
jgi:hypothetical protein